MPGEVAAPVGRADTVAEVRRRVAITGRTDSLAVLEQIERTGLFLLPLDDLREWWRYHHLFADLLRSRSQLRPERAVGVHRRAAADE